MGELRSRLPAQAQGTARVEDPVPGEGGAAGERMERVAHLAGVAREPGELRDLAVCRDAAAMAETVPTEME